MGGVIVCCTDGTLVGPFTYEEMQKFEQAYKHQPECRPWADFFSEFFYEELDGRTAKREWGRI